MRKQQAGFTLVELVMVIVILGILAATAVPRFFDLSSEANAAALQGVAGSLSSASAINYAVRSGDTATPKTKGVAVLNCSTVASTLEGGLPTGYSITALAIIAGTSEANCVLTQASTANTTNFVGHGIN